MSKTKLYKPISREVVAPDGSALVATLTSSGLQLRRKGHRTVTTVPYVLNPPDAGEREVQSETSREPIVVRLTAEGLVLREKSSRKAYTLPYGYAFLKAAMLETDRQLKERDSRKPVRIKRGLL